MEKKMRLKRKVFRYLLKRANQKGQMVVMEYTRTEKLVKKSFDQLGFFALRQKQIKKTFDLVLYVNNKKLVHQCMSEWKKLQVYFSQFTKSQHGFSIVRQCQAHFIKRYFISLKIYRARRKLQGIKKRAANEKFL
jgi:hypothetical protein